MIDRERRDSSGAAEVCLPSDESRLLRARLGQLGLASIVDVHTHFMPDRVMAKVWSYFDHVGPLTGREWPIAYRYSESERLDRLRDLGVSRFTSLVYPHKPGMATWLNDWCAQFAARTPDCLHSATFYPEPGADGYVREALAAGAKVFKAHVQVGDYDPNDPLLDPVWSIMESSGTPVIIHAGHGPAPGTFTGPDGMRRLLRRYPGLCLIVAHLGLPDYGQFIDLVEQYPRVHLDTTMVFTAFTEVNHPFPEALRPRLLDIGDRILFGSDFPNIPYSYLDAVDAILNLDLGSSWARGVLHDNADRLLDPSVTRQGR